MCVTSHQGLCSLYSDYDTGLVRVQPGTGGFSCLRIAQADSGARPARCSVVAGVRSRLVKLSRREVNHSSPSSDEVIGGDTPLLPLYAFIVWTGKTLSFTC